MRYHLDNLKNMKNTQGGVLLLLKLQASAFQLFAMLSAIWYHLYNLKTMKNTQAWVLCTIWLKPATLLKSHSSMSAFNVLTNCTNFINCTNDTKLCKAFHFMCIVNSIQKCLISIRKQSFDLKRKSNDWFLHIMQQAWNGLALPLWDEVLQDPGIFSITSFGYQKRNYSTLFRYTQP